MGIRRLGRIGQGGDGPVTADELLRLTQLSSKAGGGCKIGPGDLARVLRHLPPSIPDPNVLVGLDAPDDAGIYRLADDVALVQTVDFFTPIVDDPYAFGQIAAANALSDVYAMGGRPLCALNIVGFPVKKLPPQVLGDILRGGADKVREAGAVIIGDRKSTRLNSSHVKISYAVFCLKKKRALMG